MGVLCQLLWRLGTVGSRCLALVLYASVYHGWVFLFALLHWVCMLTWLVMQVRKRDFHFLPEAKPTGHRKVRVVVVVVVVVVGGLLWGHDLKGKYKVKVKVNLWFAFFPLSPTLNFLRGGIHTRINWENGSHWPDFSSGWDPYPN